MCFFSSSSMFCIYMHTYLVVHLKNLCLFFWRCCLVILILLHHTFYHSIEWFQVLIVVQMINILMRRKKKKKRRRPFFQRIVMNVKRIKSNARVNHNKWMYSILCERKKKCTQKSFKDVYISNKESKVNGFFFRWRLRQVALLILKKNIISLSSFFLFNTKKNLKNVFITKQYSYLFSYLSVI